MKVGVAARAVAVWAVILAVAVANGALREAVLVPSLGTPAAFVLSGLLLSCLIVLAAYVFLPWMQLSRTNALLMVGLGWLALTLAFEFSLGLLRGLPMAEILDAYTFEDGNIWPVVLVITALAPLMADRLRGPAFDIAAIGDTWNAWPLTHDDIPGTLHVRQLPPALPRKDVPLVALAWRDAALSAEAMAVQTQAIQQALEREGACLLVLAHHMPDRGTWYAYAATQAALDAAFQSLGDPAVHWGINDDPGWAEYDNARSLVDS